MAFYISPRGRDFSNSKLIWWVCDKNWERSTCVVVLHEKKKNLHEEKCVLFPFKTGTFVSKFASVGRKWKILLFNFRSISTDIKNKNPISIKTRPRRLDVHLQISKSLNVSRVSIQIFRKKEHLNVGKCLVVRICPHRYPYLNEQWSGLL